MYAQSTFVESGRHWWSFVVRGILAMLFGVLAIVWPGLTLLVLVTLFGAYALVDGVVSIVSAFRGTGFHWSLLLWGLLGIASGIIAFAWPGLTAVALVLLIGVWAITTGAMQIATAVRLRREIEGEWFLAFAGVMSILFGALVLFFPGAGALSVTWLIGAYAVVFGIVLVALGFRLRRHGSTASATTREPALGSR